MKALAKGLVRTRLSLPFLVEVGKEVERGMFEVYA